ncbi:MAG: oligosaccharide flippase family protein [Thermoanaerobaculia bacterium]
MTPKDTAARFFRSAGAATFSQLWRVGVTFAIRLLLRRLVEPADWGLWDWALSVFLVLGAVRDLGLVYHVVRVKPRPYGNLLALELGWGGLLVVATFAGAPLLSLGYANPNPNVVPVIQALSLFLLFDGLASVPRVYFEGELAIGRAVVPELVRNLVFAATSVALAYFGHGVWSLVVAHVAAAGVYAAHLWLRAYPRIPLRWERGKTMSLLRASIPLALIWFLIILTRQAGPLILATKYPGAVVGTYGFAFETTFLVSTILVPAVARALYPALVAFAAKPRQSFEAYRLATLFVLTLEAPAAVFLFANAEVAIRILGGEAWVDAPRFLRILCFAPLIDPLTRLGGELLKTYHRDWIWILSSTITLFSLCTGGILLTRTMGAEGMAWANYLAFGGILMAYGIYKVSPESFRALVKEVALVYLVPVPVFLAAYLAAGDDLWLRFALSIAALAVSLAVYAKRFGASFVTFFRGAEGATAATGDG